MKKWPECCYATDDTGQITKFLCSKNGWVDGLAPCQCPHHHGEVSLHDQMRSRGYRWIA